MNCELKRQEKIHPEIKREKEELDEILMLFEGRFVNEDYIS